MEQALKSRATSRRFKRVVHRIPYGSRVDIVGPFGVAYTEDGKSRVRFWSTQGEVTIPAGRLAT